MTAQEMRAEIGKITLENVFKILSLSNKYFNVYLMSFAFRDSELQHMFYVKPLRVDGTELPEGYYFVSENRARAFMSEFRVYHNLAWWQAIKTNHHQQYSCMAQLYKVRNEVKGGEE